MAQELTVRIKGDASQFERTMARASTSASGFGAGLKGALGTLGIGVSAGMAINYVRNLATELDGIGDSARKMMISTKYFQELAYAGKFVDVSVEAVGVGIKTMARAIKDAERGTGEGIYAFYGMGVQLEKLKGMKPEDQFKYLGKELLKVEDETTRLTYAQLLFGRSGQQLIPILQDYEKYAKEIQDKGLMFTPEAIAAGEKFNDSLQRVTISMKTLIANSGIFEYLANQMGAAESVTSMKSGIEERVKGVLSLVTGGLSDVKTGYAVNKRMAGKFDKIEAAGVGGKTINSAIFNGSALAGTIGAGFDKASSAPMNDEKVLEELKKIREKLPGETSGREATP